jgi:SAM-dependent MidA family methyltransferase
VADEKWPENQRVEIHESYRHWLAENLTGWKSGAMLTIDYGDTCPQLYHRRPRGTLRAYAHHQRLEGAGAYGGFGQRDLTTDVNFSDLIRWSPAGTNDLMTLSAFLAKYHRSVEGQLAEAGEAFQVLIQAR